MEGGGRKSAKKFVLEINLEWIDGPKTHPNPIVGVILTTLRFSGRCGPILWPNAVKNSNSKQILTSTHLELGFSVHIVPR